MTNHERYQRAFSTLHPSRQWNMEGTEMKQAYRNLIDKGIDCLYITISAIDYENRMQELLDDAIIPNRIKTLAQDDLAPLAYGALFGLTISNPEEEAATVVKQIKAVINSCPNQRLCRE